MAGTICRDAPGAVDYKPAPKNCVKSRKMNVGRVMVAAVVLFGFTLPARDWPSWGGEDAGRNMYSPARDLPATFDPGKLKPGSDQVDLATTRNVKWVVKLGSQSYGNPVVAGGRVFVGTNNEPPRDKRHAGDRSILLCLNEQTGQLLWQLVVPKLKAGKANDWESLGILSSPAVVGNQVYLVTSRCEVLCLDTEGLANGNGGLFQNEAAYAVQETGLPSVEPGPKDADIIWRYDMLDELGVFPHNAANGSVLVIGNLVYAPTANGADWTHANVPSPYAPSLIVLDRRNGRLLGVDEAKIGPRIFHGQWSSPSGGVVNGRQLVFLGGGDGWVYGLEAQTYNLEGTNILKVAWKADCNPPEYRVKDGKPAKYGSPEGPSEVNATPVFWRDRVYVTIGQDPEQGEGAGCLTCFDARKSGDVTKRGFVWEFRQIHRSLSTVAIDPQTQLLFVADFSGFVYCLDARNGTLHWTHDMKAHVWGSTLVADGKVYVGDEDGDLCVLAAGKEKKVLAEANFGAPIYSTPIVANGVLYVSTQTHLYALSNQPGR
jgi:outer membrane protein assembly factor BamB